MKERRKRKRQKVQDRDLQETEWKETGKDNTQTVQTDCKVKGGKATKEQNDKEG